MDFFNQYIALVDGVKLTSLVGLIIADLVLGVLVAIFTKTFKWSQLTDFLYSDVIQLAAGYLVIGAVAVFESSLVFMVPAAWLLIDAKLIADIVIKLKVLGVAIKGQK